MLNTLFQGFFDTDMTSVDLRFDLYVWDARLQLD